MAFTVEEYRAAFDRAGEQLREYVELVMRAAAKLDLVLARQAFIAAGGDPREIEEIEEMYGVTFE